MVILDTGQASDVLYLVCWHLAVYLRYLYLVACRCPSEVYVVGNRDGEKQPTGVYPLCLGGWLPAGCSTNIHSG